MMIDSRPGAMARAACMLVGEQALRAGQDGAASAYAAGAAIDGSRAGADVIRAQVLSALRSGVSPAGDTPGTAKRVAEDALDPALSRAGLHSIPHAAPALRAPARDIVRPLAAGGTAPHERVLSVLAASSRDGIEQAAGSERLRAHQVLVDALRTHASAAEAAVDNVVEAARRASAALRDAGSQASGDAASGAVASQRALHDALLRAIGAASNAAQQYLEAVRRSIGSTVAPDRPVRTAAETHATDLVLLMAQLSTMLRDAAVDDEKAHEKVMKTVQDLRAVRARRQAEDYAKELEKARVAERTLGTASKVIGIGLAILGFLGAIFTGGASLAVAAVGLALTAADTIYEAATGKSFIAEALAPVMKQVGKWIQGVAKAITWLCKAAHMDDAAAQITGQVMALVATVGAVVLAIYGARGAAGKFVGKLLMKVARPLLRSLQAAVGKVGLRPMLAQLRQGIRPLTDAFAKLQARLLPANAREAAVFQKAIVRWQTRAETLGAATTSGMVVGDGYMQSRVGESESKAIRANYDLAEQRSFIQQSGADLGRRASLADSLAATISQMVANDAAAKQAIAHNLARI